ncbi:phage portal protein [Viridibacillus sp. FSL H7-0596]|uniref:phage portal protein n=1 Tax=Viridibacillus sp. FSL H7-0596 TaxID=1928923 RepID=UPI00096C960B|nr:phage portal protein [Viridibacillus sp. FSL H7-0596]OMC86919.1 phage portal protein [Viridibacillus sp. FSL H7-0596]
MSYFEGRTHTDELIEIINANKPTPTEVLKGIFDEFNSSEMKKGVAYYNNQTDILKRKIYMYQDDVKMVDDEAINIRIPSGYHKILVDQKVAYLAGEPMSFGSKSDNKKNLELLEELIGERWEDTLPELIKNASNKGLEWLHPFVNEDGEFDYMVIPAESFIPIYDYSKRKKLIAGIRFYEYSKDHLKLEVWTADDVTFYEMISGEIYLDATEEMNPAPHFATADGLEGKSWGKVPFVEFANNNERVGDLHFTKEQIDAYDLLTSDAQNTLTEMQSLILVLKGYDGTDTSEFKTELKRRKVIKVGEEGGVDTLTAEVPVEAYKTQTGKLDDDIFKFGQGVNPSPDVIGDAPSGVALENLYSLLDMKSSILERKFTLALREFMWFIQEYCKHAKLGEFDYRDITFAFNKMLLTNESEIVDMANKSATVISRTTILENHPWVKDVALEKRRLEEDAKLYDIGLEPLVEDGEDNGSVGD